MKRALFPYTSWLLTLLLCPLVHAQSPAPKLLPFQGRLTDHLGNAVTNGTRLVMFQIFDSPVSGKVVWAGELHRTTVNGGLVNVQLGTGTPLDKLDFDQPRYLQITLDLNGDGQFNEADPPMLPRQAILPAIFAKEAADSRRLAGHDWSALFGVNNPTGVIPPGKLPDISADKIIGPIPSSKLANNLAVSSVTASGAIAASTFAGNGAALTGLNLSNATTYVKGQIRQVRYAETTEHIALSPFDVNLGSPGVADDPLPISKGTKVLEVTVNPMSGNNYLLVEVETSGAEKNQGGDGSNMFIAALFKDARPGSIAVGQNSYAAESRPFGALNGGQVVMRKRVDLGGSVAPVTLTVRAGMLNGGQAELNYHLTLGIRANFGNSAVTSIKVSEIEN